MKYVEKYMGVNTSDVEQLLPSLKRASERMCKDYDQGTHPKLKMLDALIVLSLLSFAIQVVYAYGIVRSNDPFNSYLAGIFCSIGQFALAGKSSLYFLLR